MFGRLKFAIERWCFMMLQDDDVVVVVRTKLQIQCQWTSDLEAFKDYVTLEGEEEG